ncbi:YciI family protein [Rhodococcus sp. NPDC058521]|uniref:YciI family protein n=1 Tax=Rhodococcus sp. NPDC058521 TaxID=3346536 RepID=UPI0036476A86
MPLFAVEYTYAPEKSGARDSKRPDHRAWLQDLVERRVVRASGPYADGSGALIIVEEADADAVRTLFTHDPFARAGLVEDSRITEWVPVMGAISA